MTDLPIGNECPYCRGPLRTTRKACDACRVGIEANFPAEPLGRLPLEHQRFIEMFVIAGGSLKEIAKQAGVSYPTVRNRLDKVISELRVQLANTDPADGPGSSPATDDAAQIIKNI
ncbi:MAG: DUF2089 family protein [Planctomycetales bacterium]|nr:DUF2089 family protein [Planctomycetales bacterium]